MEINQNILLQKLPPFKNAKVEIIGDQDVNDIIKNLLAYHDKYTEDYKKIAPYFIGIDDEHTLKNIFNYLKKNVQYSVESTDNQTLRSPSAIVAMGKNDCKNYSLFIGGILQALNDLGYYFPFAYRFASYSIFNKQPGHVFIVVYPKKNEVWIDPVLQNFNQQKQPYYFKDYKTKKMLQGISGISADGVIDAGASIATGNFAAAAAKIFSFLQNQPNPNDWLGWSAGDAKYWVKNDGDSVKNEGLNILSFINAHGFQDITDSDAYGVNRVTIADIAKKLIRGGFVNESKQLQDAYYNLGDFPVVSSESGSNVPSTYVQPGPSTNQASINKWVTYGLIGAALILVLKGKK